MKIFIVTIFPEMFNGPLTASIVQKAREKGLVEINIVNLRDFATGKHKSVDDYPYGGGPGMVMKPEPIFKAVEHIRDKTCVQKVILFSPQGLPFSQAKARELSSLDSIIMICGHYEGVDERVNLGLVDEEISLGDYILTGGELPAMVVTDAVVRLLPGVLPRESTEKDSFENMLLEHPQYTRPPRYKGFDVPSVLLSGDHESIARWRLKKSLKRTLYRRPDLIKKRGLTSFEEQLLSEPD